MHRKVIAIASSIALTLCCADALAHFSSLALHSKADGGLRVEAKALAFNHRQRPATPAEQAAFSSVGAFYCKSKNGWHHFGTGFLTEHSSQKVVTNEHIFTFVDQSDDVCDGKRRYPDIKFFLAACNEFFDVVDRRARTNDVTSNRGKDLAVVTLRKPACASAKGLRMRVLSDKDMSALTKGGAVVVSTYPAAPITPGKLAVLKGLEAAKSAGEVEGITLSVGAGRLGKIIDEPENEYFVEHTVSTFYGASGSPTVASWKGSYAAFGVHSGFENDQSDHNWSIAFTDSIIGWIRSASD